MAEINDFSFEQIFVGQTAEFEATITEHMMDEFSEISGDINPLHCDECYARSMGHPGRVVYGMLTASLYSKLAGVYLPGKNCLLYEINSSFRLPAYIGDTLHVSGMVKEKNDTFRFVLIKAQIMNQRGEKVSKATVKAGVTEKRTGEYDGR